MRRHNDKVCETVDSQDQGQAGASSCHRDSCGLARDHHLAQLREPARMASIASSSSSSPNVLATRAAAPPPVLVTDRDASASAPRALCSSLVRETSMCASSLDRALALGSDSPYRFAGASRRNPLLSRAADDLHDYDSRAWRTSTRDQALRLGRYVSPLQRISLR